MPNSFLNTPPEILVYNTYSFLNTPPEILELTIPNSFLNTPPEILELTIPNSFLNTPPEILLVLPPPGEHRDTSLCQGGSNLVLGTVDVTGRPSYLINIIINYQPTEKVL